MNELKNLPEYTDRALNGLVADESLKHRILSKAAETGTAKRNPFIRPVMILGTVVAACLLLAVALNNIRPVNNDSQYQMNVFSAGKNETERPAADNGDLFASLSGITDVKRIECASLGDVSDPDDCAGLVRILKAESVEIHTGQVSGNEMIIHLADGGTVRLFISEPYLFTEDGCWECARFFDAYRELIEEK